MASSLNRLMVIGNVGKEPELRYTPDGTATSRFSVAANRRWMATDGTWQEETEWFTVVVWRDLAEKVDAYIKKGQKVYVEGRLQTRKWNDPQGVERRFTDLIANRIVVMWNARNSSEEGAAPGLILEEDEANGGISDSLNSFSVIGRLNDDPKYTAEGTPRANFTLLVKHGWKTPDGEHKEVTEYINVVAWRRLAETIGNSLGKGQKVYVEGRLQNRKYTDRDGNEKRTTDLVANQVVYMARPRATGAAPGEEETGGPMPDEGTEPGSDEIPFG